MPYLMQSKLLRVLEEGEIERVGGTKPKQVDFRLICTTNRPLEQMIKKGTFRLDLFYRINVITITIPALRNISDDIPLMVRHFLRKLEKTGDNRVENISDEALKVLKNYEWPGNVRELKNVIERAIVLCPGNCIQADDLPAALLQKKGPFYESKSGGMPTLKEIKKISERDAIIKALRLTGNNKSAAAKLLDIHRTAIYQKIEKYEISE
jgi:transcriptional regulator with PAS, ATPase and Fis domain